MAAAAAAAAGAAAQLLEGAAAQRLGQLGRRPDAQDMWPSAGGSISWRHNALAAAVTAHNCELILHALADRATQLAQSRPRRNGLRAAADAVRQARESWQDLTHAWDRFTTGTSTGPSPIGSELDDLVLWIGRLARDHPAWTPARARTSHPRDPAELAPTASDIPAITSAISHALAAVTCIARQDQHAAAAAARSLYSPARLRESGHLAHVYRYLPAPPGQTRELTACYQAAIAATDHATASLTSLLPSFRGPSPDHAVAHAITWNPATIGHLLTQPGQQQPASPATAIPIPNPGELVRFLAKLEITDTEFLLRAMTLDRANHVLKIEATTRAQARATAADEAKHGQGRNPTTLSKNRKALAARQDQPATPYRPGPAITTAPPATRPPATTAPRPRRQQ